MVPGLAWGLSFRICYRSHRAIGRFAPGVTRRLLAQLRQALSFSGSGQQQARQQVPLPGLPPPEESLDFGFLLFYLLEGVWGEAPMEIFSKNRYKLAHL